MHVIALLYSLTPQGDKEYPSALGLLVTKTSYGGQSVLIDMLQVATQLKVKQQEVWKILATEVCAFGPPPTRRFAPILQYNEEGFRASIRLDLYGYYSVKVFEVFDILAEYMRKNAILIALDNEQGYCICNGSVLHGRLPLSGARSIIRLLMRRVRDNTFPCA